MRKSIGTSARLLTAGMIAGMAACGGAGSADSQLESDMARAQSLRSELASAAISDGQQVSGALETAEAEVPAPAPARKPAPKVEKLAPPVLPPPSLALAGVRSEPAPIEMPSVSTPHIDAPAAGPAMPAARPQVVDASMPEGLGDNGRSWPAEDPGMGVPRLPGGIIIRGGPTTGRDPCAIHPPRPGSPTIYPGGVVNPGGRTAGGMGGMVNNRIPTRGAGFPRGGIR